ncbi:MAG: hypothetical protein ABEJ61_08985 [Haloferacaceae archaeon]
MPSSTDLSVTDPGSLSADARVRHVDELDERAQAFLDAARAEGTTPDDPPADLTPGDVVVFTEYYRVR